jgi:hypothetical protein
LLFSGPAVAKAGRDRHLYSVGERWTYQSDHSFSSAAAARAALGRPFYVYLVPGYRPHAGFPTVDEDAMRVVHVWLHQFKPNDSYLRFKAEFTVPDIPGGTYSAVFCDLGCRTPFGRPPLVARVLIAGAVDRRLAARLHAGLKSLDSHVERIETDVREHIYFAPDEFDRATPREQDRHRIIRADDSSAGQR